MVLSHGGGTVPLAPGPPARICQVSALRQEIRQGLRGPHAFAGRQLGCHALLRSGGQVGDVRPGTSEVGRERLEAELDVALLIEPNLKRLKR